MADAVCRLIRSLGKRVATEDPNGLKALLDLDRELAAAWQVAIDGLRRSAFTDGAIGEVLGTSRQAVEQRWPWPEKERTG